jgi:hypothetical protein
MAITLGMQLAREPVLAALLVARLSTLLVVLLGAGLLFGGMHGVAPRGVTRHRGSAERGPSAPQFGER